MWVLLFRQATLRIWCVTSKWLARRLVRPSSRQSWSLLSPRPTVWQIWRSLYLALTMPRSFRLANAVMKRRCTKLRSCSSTTFPTLLVWHPLWCTLESSRMQLTRQGRPTPPEPGKRWALIGKWLQWGQLVSSCSEVRAPVLWWFCHF